MFASKPKEAQLAFNNILKYFKFMTCRQEMSHQKCDQSWKLEP